MPDVPSKAKANGTAKHTKHTQQKGLEKNAAKKHTQKLAGKYRTNHIQKVKHMKKDNEKHAEI